MRIVFIGPPGVGKGTQSARFVKYLNVPHLSTGDMLRQACQEKSDLGLLSQQFMTQGKLVPDPIVLQLIARRLAEPDSQGGFLLDGFPRTLGQAQELDRFLRERGTPLTAAIELQVDTDELAKRLAGRGREDDRPEIVRKRLEEYARQTSPLSDYYRRTGQLYTLHGGGTTDEVFNRIRTVVDQIAQKKRTALQ
jgi:adenylate kinase